VAKGAIVFGGTLLLSCVAVAAFRRIFRGDQIVGGRRANGIVTSSRRFTNVERVPEPIIGREVL
jgi:hypothetical protein